MGRKKKTDPEFVPAVIGDNLVRIAIRYDKKLADLLILNPDIRGCNKLLCQGRRIRIS